MGGFVFEWNTSHLVLPKPSEDFFDRKTLIAIDLESTSHISLTADDVLKVLMNLNSYSITLHPILLPRYLSNIYSFVIFHCGLSYLT